ncbi:MAG TPA: tetratricopeptide repeat protein [Candidatus Angelobacter sp.]|nr:tetratricopeptide repeat protein [Candidatus Angelobacter sp.]
MAAAANPTVPDFGAKRGVVFISYRHSDAGGHSSLVYQALVKEFGKRRVFRDVDTIAAGTDFKTAIRETLLRSSALLVIVGPDWLKATGSDGHARLADPEDYVRWEIEFALQSNLKIIPVLVGEAAVLSPGDLPESLRKFADVEAFKLRPSKKHWHSDFSELVVVIRSIVDPSFRIRRVLLATVALLALVAGAFWTKYRIEEQRIDQIRQDIEENGKANESYLKELEFKYGSEPADPRIHVYRAEAYQKMGNFAEQRREAELAAESAKGANYNFVMGRAKYLACNAKVKMDLTAATADCEQSLPFSSLAKDDQGHVRAMNTIANSLYYGKKYDEAEKQYNRVLEFAQAHTLRLDEYGCLNNLGMLYQDLRKSDQASHSYEAAAKGFEKEGLNGEASNAYNNLGTISLDRGEVDKAEDSLEKALRLAQQPVDKPRLAQVQMNFGMYYEKTGLLDKAVESLNLALKNYTDLGLTNDIASVNVVLGDVYLQKGMYDPAQNSYDAAAKQGSDFRALAMASLVNLEIQRSQPPKNQSRSEINAAIAQVDAAIQKAKEEGDTDAETFAHIIKARLLLRENNTDEASEEADGAQKQAIQDRQPEHEVAAGIVLAEIKAMHGALQQALVDLNELTNRSSHANVIPNFEVRLAIAKLMLKYGNGQQRGEAKGRLQDILNEAQHNSYGLLATKAQVALDGKAL